MKITPTLDDFSGELVSMLSLILIKSKKSLFQPVKFINPARTRDPRIKTKIDLKSGGSGVLKSFNYHYQGSLI